MSDASVEIKVSDKQTEDRSYVVTDNEMDNVNPAVYQVNPR